MYHSLLIYWPIEECVGCFQVLALYYKHLCTDFCVNVSLLFFFKNKFIYLFNLFLAALGLCCCAQVSLVAASGLLIAVASLVAEHGL